MTITIDVKTGEVIRYRSPFLRPHEKKLANDFRKIILENTGLEHDAEKLEAHSMLIHQIKEDGEIHIINGRLGHDHPLMVVLDKHRIEPKYSVPKLKSKRGNRDGVRRSELSRPAHV